MQGNEHAIKITPKAINKAHSLLQAPANLGCSLRVFIEGGGCSGFKYGFALDKQPNPDDTVIQKEAVTVLIDCMSMQYLHGSEIDYQETLQASQFVVKNPHAKTTCGCGSSFSIE